MSATRPAPTPSPPPTPVPKFKYLDDPDKYDRSYAHRQTPFEGDFCVLSLDHVASFAHLGAEAMEAAKRIPSGRYIVYTALVSVVSNAPLQATHNTLYSLLVFLGKVARPTRSASYPSAKVYPHSPSSATTRRPAFLSYRALNVTVGVNR